MIELDRIHRDILPAAYALLPEKMKSQAATAMSLAIGLQESRFKHWVQVGGPAHGYWQFEKGGGVRGVLSHPASRPHILFVCDKLGYVPDSTTLYAAIVDDDVLAACMARLLLYTLPGKLPAPGDPEGSWMQYVEAWRPGKPHRHTWDAFYDQAWEIAAEVADA